MELEITKYGEPILRRKGEKITEINQEIKLFIQDMLNTLVKAEGVGLAAQQVGKAYQLCVIDVRLSDRPSWIKIDGKETDVSMHMPMVLINPVLTLGTELEKGPEGCLSFPDIFANIKRSSQITVSALNEKGEEFHFECGGLLARAIQHEYDHLQGILFIDRMGYLDREENDQNLIYLRNKTKERLKRQRKRQ